jgi:uncharacterized repeat protein (TIGR03833 family)
VVKNPSNITYPFLLGLLHQSSVKKASFGSGQNLRLAKFRFPCLRTNPLRKLRPFISSAFLTQANAPIFHPILFSFVDMDGTQRKDIKPGLRVKIILKADQRSGKLTEGVVQALLTKAPHHSRGIKVRLTDGQVGRVHEIIAESE